MTGKLSETHQAMRDALAEAFPGWTIWVVLRVYGGPVWCAGRGLQSEVHGGSDKELADHIRMKLEDEAETVRRASQT